MCDLGIEGRCQNPVDCEKRRLIFKAQNEKMLELYGYTEFDIFKQSLIGENGKIRKNVFKRSVHYEKQSLERVFSDAEIAAIIKEGDVIEFWQDKKEKVMLVWGNIYNPAKYAKTKYRPAHIVFKKNIFDDDSRWTLATIYNPKSMPWKWDNSHTRRVCFCKK